MTDLIKTDIFTYLKKRPSLSDGFKLMIDWPDVINTSEDQEAQNLYLQRKQIALDFEDISNHRSEVKLLTFLRYDYKKVLVRTRFLYLDRIFNSATSELEGDDLDFAFFEPIHLSFPNLEFIGRLRFPNLYDPSKNDSGKLLRTMLNQMGSGYQKYSNELADWHRNALSHELRPDKIWTYDLNTEKKYGPPSWANGGLYLNIPHFIDSSILEIEKLCDDITGPSSKAVINSVCDYVSKRFQKNR